ncbi:hypothetical protein PTSG_08997 [Salpingoeca rosetta]|uniref:DDHD domain-containing protein n=1 Tax=Salpingoeca rosetta (strain ATCC 50818 / BSB-021) TaxID=946362 RepID=F2ULX0_SALR5|nr:uncharacterized protein PTSG_08997 [Salpingoeca rosetta]EGD78119.1 hypothetical protein PTSG_08997 [Salpingoeca rosetta]|eukprot:XP_004989795.1 hypothetical protein PTSG_08997 [Salpingoeca rosetta]
MAARWFFVLPEAGSKAWHLDAGSSDKQQDTQTTTTTTKKTKKGEDASVSKSKKKKAKGQRKDLLSEKDQIDNARPLCQHDSQALEKAWQQMKHRLTHVARKYTAGTAAEDSGHVYDGSGSDGGGDSDLGDAAADTADAVSVDKGAEEMKRDRDLDATMLMAERMRNATSTVPAPVAGRAGEEDTTDEQGEHVEQAPDETEEPEGEHKSPRYVFIFGGAYRVDVLQLKAVPYLWKGRPLQVFRATWFKQSGRHMLPIGDKLARYLELHHHIARRRMQSAKPNVEHAAKRVEIYRVTQESTAYTWHSDGTIFSTPSFVSFLKSQQLFHGYDTVGTHRQGEESSVDEVVEPNCHCGETTHLVFVVHGIGQNFDESIEKHALSFDRQMRKIARKGVFGRSYRIGAKRVQFIPIQWRNTLALNTDTIRAITPEAFLKLRFSVSNLFLLGSPVAIFLAMRGAQAAGNTCVALMVECGRT